MTTPLSFSLDQGPDDAPVLCAVGEIDMSNSAELAAAVDGALKRTTGRVIIDLTLVEYLDSAALSILLTRAERIELLAGPLIAPVLTITGLGDLTTITDQRPPSVP
jgi:anti-sigma B factor antagonist